MGATQWQSKRSQLTPCSAPQKSHQDLKKNDEEEGEEEDKEKEGIGVARASPMAHPAIYIRRPGTTTFKEQRDSACQLRPRARYK